jgi:hypothetical protein
MGWAAGNELADEVWGIVREYIPTHQRKVIAREIIEVFEREDADAWDGGTLIEEDADLYQADDGEDLEED